LTSKQAANFLAGDSLSIADLMLAPQLDFFAETPEGKSLLHDTRLKAWLDRMNARPSMQATPRPKALRRAGGVTHNRKPGDPLSPGRRAVGVLRSVF